MPTTCAVLRSKLQRQRCARPRDLDPVLNPLALALHPLMPVRTPRAGRASVLYGYNLRLADGLVVTHDDPLLAAFGSSVDFLKEPLADDDALQEKSFDPGTRLHLVREG